MKKTKLSLLALFMATVIVFSGVGTAYATVSSDKNVYGENITFESPKRIEMADIVRNLAGDPMISTMEKTDNAVYFTMINGIESSIEIENSEKSATLTCTEGDISQIVLIDYSSNAVYIDGQRVHVRYSEIETGHDNESISAVSSGTVWDQIGQPVYCGVDFSSPIKDLIISTIFSVLTYFLTGAISITLSACSTIRSFFVSANSNADHVYVKRIEYHEHNVYDHFLEKIFYYKNSNYTTLITSTSKETYE